MRVASVAVLLLLAGACAFRPPPFAGAGIPDDDPMVDVAAIADPSAEEAGARWFHAAHGGDVLEAWEMWGFGRPIRFGLARKWTGDRVKVLTYVTDPPALHGVAILTERGPDGYGHTLVTAQRTVVRRLPTFRPSLASGEAQGIGSEVAYPFLPGELSHARLPDRELDGQLCSVIESRPAERARDWTHLRLWLSKRTGVALRTSYYDGRNEIRRVTVRPENVEQREGVWIGVRRTVRTADGREAVLQLRNTLRHVSLPGRLFTVQNLMAQRFPRF